MNKIFSASLNAIVVCFIFALPSFAKAKSAYTVIRCAEPTSGWILIKIKTGSSIVTTSEDSWTESDSRSILKKFSATLGDDIYLKAKATRSSQTYELELQTQTEDLLLRIDSDLKAGKYFVNSRDDSAPEQSAVLTCAPYSGAIGELE